MAPAQPFTPPVQRTGRPPDPAPPPRGRLLAVVLTVQFMVALDVSVVNVALPDIRADLGFTGDNLTWVINAYALAFGGLMMLGGRLGDLAGRRRTLLAGLVVFGLASLAGGLTQSPGWLITARAVQGAGAAALAPVALALLTTGFPRGPALSRALGLWGATAAVGGAVGVLAGGLLTEAFGWRAVMLVNVPIVAFALGAGLRLASEPRAGGAARRPDLAGALFVTAGAAALVLGVVRTGEVGWASPATALTLAAAAVLLAAFVAVELRVREPLLRMRLLAVRPVLGANLFMMLLFSGQFAAFFFTSLYLHRVLGYGPTAAGVAFLPFCVGIVLGSAIATRAVAPLGLRLPLVLGGLVGAAGFAWFGLAFAANGGFWTAIPGPSLVAATGIGMCVVPLGTAATSGVEPGEAGMASGLINTSRQVGGSIGLAVLDTLAATVMGGHGGASTAAAADGYGAALGAAGALLAVAAAVALALIPGRRPAS
ncbi:MFS transporter [Streptomyces litchfieldiae]|uniref:MFS transporter n=1 Tax=Streptomyces litchfieldiae TaxID=3075543 RepID=A0ABU2MYE4_9ACTN|nr:MFS transporter [Streptomyces sp. DSM 44938]MDT0346064.1 MFS transporter [Streptomyces sp. DSM 44938]